MSDVTQVKIPDSAEKAYAAAAETVAASDTVVLPALLAEESKPALPQAKAAPAKVVATAKPVIAAKPAKVAKAPAPAAKTPAPATKAPVQLVKKTKSPAIKAAPIKPTTVKPTTVKPRAAKPAVKKPAVITGTSIIAKSKDTIMAKTTDFTATIKTALVEVKSKAQAAFEKGSAVATETTEFAKGHVEATVESGKILAAGLKTLGTDYVAESKKALETMTADVKELAAVKSPTDFFQLQANLMRRNFEAAVAYGTKSSAAATKLANEAFAPISARVSLAVEKLNKAA